jgi:hypothetical protein
MFGRLSLGNLGIVVGSILTVIGIIAYITDNATLNLAGFFYGMPLLLGGFALKTGELKPVPFSQETTAEVLKLRQEQSTITQTKLRKDVTRYVYGQDIHLEEALQKVGLSPNEDDRPILTSIYETVIDGAYTLVLQFESPRLPLENWQVQKEKMERFFGPDITIHISKSEGDLIDVALIKVISQ